MPLVSCPGGFTVFPMSLLAVFLLSFHIRAARADYSLVVLLQSSPAWDTLTPRHKICSTGAGSPARRFSNCASKDCFCDKPKEIDEKLMECVTSWSLAIEDPLDAYNGAMSFYASECGTFVFQRKEYLTREVIYQNAAPTPAPSPAGGGIGGEATTTRYSPRYKRRNNTPVLNLQQRRRQTPRQEAAEVAAAAAASD
ncbi:hypothetical protein V8F20_008596 [Naviculisporaceae sp. PSN 640]